MALKFSQGDRSFMRIFAIGIALLGVITLINLSIAMWVWSSQEASDKEQVTAFAADTPTLMGTMKDQGSKQ